MKKSMGQLTENLLKVVGVFFGTFIILFAVIYGVIALAACDSQICNWSADLQGAYGFGSVLSIIAGIIVGAIVAGYIDWD